MLVLFSSLLNPAAFTTQQCDQPFLRLSSNGQLDHMLALNKQQTMLHQQNVSPISDWSASQL